MFEVLMYLFENYMNGSVTVEAKPDEIMSELEMAGFHKGEIGLALDWLDGLQRLQTNGQTGQNITALSMRHYTIEEVVRLSTEGIGFLHHLQRLGILDPMTREVVVDRLMALERREVDLGRIRWVVLFALFNQPDKKIAMSLLQDMILSETIGTLH